MTPDAEVAGKRLRTDAMRAMGDSSATEMGGDAGIPASLMGKRSADAGMAWG